MVLNPGKRYYMTFDLNTTKNEFVSKCGTIFPFAEKHVVLGITIYSHFNLYSYLKKLCKNVANNINALARIAPYLSYNQRRLVCSSLFTGQLSYRPLIRTF